MFETAVIILAINTQTADLVDVPERNGSSTTLVADADRSKSSESPDGAADMPDKKKTDVRNAPNQSLTASSKGEKKVDAERQPVPKIHLKTTSERAAYMKRYQTLARKSFLRNKPDPGIVVPELVNMFNELRLIEGIRRSELNRMKKTLRARMIAFADKLAKDVAKSKRDGKGSRVVKRGQGSTKKSNQVPPKFAGRTNIDALLNTNRATDPRTMSDNKKQSDGDAKQQADNNVPSDESSQVPAALAATHQQNAQALINLIQDTVAPETWQSRGGNGSIYYYAPLHALVIRQTDEVHQQIGGVLNQLNQ